MEGSYHETAAALSEKRNSRLSGPRIVVLYLLLPGSHFLSGPLRLLYNRLYS
ncbi:hypothetical protein P389DRAFT_169170 [Cystobasidium minutum MCA 4210]|uniref:uncharacterized protein n=1 Tax=Cystobasidium minutum MCA 4210 TaxID=1397322 RepID=UPI0034CF19FF|eukprot:jgi/Rhomi1/169170/fgenesh1_kg.3_\